MIINLGIQTWDEFLEGSAGQTHFNPKAASSPSPKAWVRAALPDGVGCTLLKLQKGQEGAVEDTPQVSRCALEQVTFLVYIRTLEVQSGPCLSYQKKSLRSEGPREASDTCGVTHTSLCRVNGPLALNFVFSESWHCVSFSKQAIPEGPRLPFLDAIQAMMDDETRRWRLEGCGAPTHREGAAAQRDACLWGLTFWV